MEKWRMRAIDLLTSLAFGGRGEVAVVPYYPQKINVSGRESKYFPRTTPEKKGISSRRLYNMLCELESERRANIHSILVLCGGEVICECSADGYDVNTWHISHSMSKTVLGMVIGRLIDDRLLSLDMKLVEIFPEIPYKDKKFSGIMIDHLLSMTSGVDFAEAGVITENDWTYAYFSSPVRFSPGTRFAYNSMNSYILARVSERITGRKFSDLVKAFVFAPLGIENYLWEKGPEGTEKGGWGLYLSQESWAKIGYMLASGGVFDGTRILSKEWVRASTDTRAISPEGNGSFNYGYQLWVGRSSEEVLFNGMFGQNVWICPKNDIIVVITSGNNELFQASPALEIIRKHLGVKMVDGINNRDFSLLNKKCATFFDTRRWVRPREKGRGPIYWLGLKSRTSFDDAWEEMLGSYKIATNNVGVLPVIVRAMQNNLNTVIEKIRLYREGNGLFLEVLESGEKYLFPVGLYGYEENRVTFRGERYIVRAMGEVLHDRYGNPEHRIELIFPETASVRYIRLKKIDGGRLIIELSESPNHRIAENYLEMYSENSGIVSFVTEMLERRLGEGELSRIIQRVFNPTLVGADTSMPECDKIIYEENQMAAEESGTVKFLRVIVDRFFKEKNDEKKR